MSYTAIRTQLISILEGIKTSASIAVVYGYEAKALNQYPAVTITFSGHGDSFLDTAANQRLFTFVVRAYVRAEDSADSESILAALADNIITAIESNITLNGSCDFAKPTAGRVLDGQKDAPVRLIEITIEAFKRVAR